MTENAKDGEVRFEALHKRKLCTLSIANKRLYRQRESMVA